MVDDPRQGDREAVDAFRRALAAAAPRAGLDRVREALAGERRREMRGMIWRRRMGMVARVAAGLVCAAGVAILVRRAVTLHEVVICPHGDQAEVAGSLREFLRNPDNFQRVCRCTPLYSGSLRRPGLPEDPNSLK